MSGTSAPARSKVRRLRQLVMLVAATLMVPSGVGLAVAADTPQPQAGVVAGSPDPRAQG